jgi:hypothetical protein
MKYLIITLTLSIFSCVSIPKEKEAEFSNCYDKCVDESKEFLHKLGFIFAPWDKEVEQIKSYCFSSCREIVTSKNSKFKNFHDELIKSQGNQLQYYHGHGHY